MSFVDNAILKSKMVAVVKENAKTFYFDKHIMKKKIIEACFHHDIFCLEKKLELWVINLEWREERSVL